MDGPGEGNWQCLALREVPLEVRLGVYPHERERAQRILVDVELWRRMDRFEGTSLAECLDYDRIHRWLVETWPTRPHTELLEQLAEDLITKCLEDPRVTWCRVRIRKPEAHAGRGVPEILATRWRSKRD